MGKSIICAKGKSLSEGTIITDKIKQKWIVGSFIGQGGHGSIYSIKQINTKDFDKVIKMAPINSPSLLTEMNFFKKCCHDKQINEWVRGKKLNYLAVPRHIYGATTTDSENRCFIMDRYGDDLRKILRKTDLSLVCIFQITINILDALEYIHSKNISHGDIKSSNIVKGRKSTDQIYLIDYGIAAEFSIGGSHRPDTPDRVCRHNGTLEFCSRDSHKGLVPSRRSDIENLMFNLIYWLSWDKTKVDRYQGVGNGNLPWSSSIKGSRTPEMLNEIAESKEKYMNDTKLFVEDAGLNDYTWNNKLIEVLNNVSNLKYNEEPNYDGIRQEFAKIICEIKCKSIPCFININEFRKIEWDHPIEIRKTNKILESSDSICQFLENKDFMENEKENKCKMSNENISEERGSNLLKSKSTNKNDRRNAVRER